MKNEGESMAISDNTGFSTGSHLHLTTKRIKMVRGKVVVLDHGNGYFGAVNPQEFFDEVREAKHNIKPEPSMDPLNYVPTKKDYERLAVWHKKPTESWTVEDIIREWRVEKEQQEQLNIDLETAGGLVIDAQKKALGLQGKVTDLTGKNTGLTGKVKDLKEEIKKLKARPKAKPESGEGVHIVGKPSLEALKVLLRVLLVGLLPVAVSYLELVKLDNEVLVAAVVGVVGVLKAVDKYVHKKGKELNSEMLTKGLTRF